MSASMVQQDATITVIAVKNIENLNLTHYNFVLWIISPSIEHQEGLTTNFPSRAQISIQDTITLSSTTFGTAFRVFKSLNEFRLCENL